MMQEAGFQGAVGLPTAPPSALTGQEKVGSVLVSAPGTGCISWRNPPASWDSHDDGPPLQAARAMVEAAPLSLGWWPGPTPAHRGQALVTGGLGWGGQPQTRRGLLLTSRGFFSQGQPSSCRSRGG